MKFLRAALHEVNVRGWFGWVSIALFALCLFLGFGLPLLYALGIKV